MLPLWILSYLGMLCLGLFLGYKYEKIKSAIKDIQAQLKIKQDAKVREKKAEIIDPYDVEYQAKIAHDEIMKRLNQ